MKVLPERKTTVEMTMYPREMQEFAKLAVEADRSRHRSIGKLTVNRYLRLALLAHLVEVQPNIFREIQERRASRFPRLTFVSGKCPGCGLAVDDEYLPVRYRIDGGNWKCAICGTTETL